MINRRRLIANGIKLGSLPVLAVLPFSDNLLRAQQARAKRFLQIFLTGGWDSHLATDPVIGNKVNSLAFESVYSSLNSQQVSGKNLIVGEGLIPAIPAFSSVNTTFINGLFVEVTAHDLATRYVLSGRLALSRSVDYPSYIALMGQASGHFPAHVVLGAQIPLGATKFTAPPLQAIGLDGLTHMVQEPGYWWNLNETGRDSMSRLTNRLNQIRFGELESSRHKNNLAWGNAKSQIAEIYRASYDESLKVTDDIRSRYNFSEGQLTQAGYLASAYLLLKSGLSPFVTIMTGDYDTHSNHLPAHNVQLKDFATALNTLIQDLRNTPDPDEPQLSLIETTTILISSEFVRTPKFNLNAGTDHWQSTSAILMGCGVRDGRTIGRTDDNANAMGWQNGQAVPFTTSSKIGPENLAVAVMRHMGFDQDSNTISEVPLNGIFS